MNLPGGVERLRAIIQPFADKKILDDETQRLALEALRLIDEEVPAEGPHGGDRKSQRAKNQVGNTKLIGNTREYNLARLKKARPDLAARVIAGELSANKAAQEAGFRERMIQHPATVEGFLRAIQRHLSGRQQHELRDAIQ